MVSIHTNTIWKGSFELVRKARKRTDMPILAKGFHGTDEEIEMALDAGADFVLVVGRMPNKYADKCFIEPTTLDQLSTVPEHHWAVWNSRDLSILKDLPGIPAFLEERWKYMRSYSDRKRESFQEARMKFKGKLCQASKLKTKKDIEPGADAVLVGSDLETFAKSLGITL